jgi:hypothetical protein
VVGPWVVTGEIVAVRLTVELKLFVLLIVIVNVVDAPLLSDCEEGLGVIVKSGGELATITDTVVL